MPMLRRLDPLIAVWRRRVTTPWRRAGLASVVAVVFAGAHGARFGTPAARLAVALGVVGLVAALIGRWWRAQRALSDPRRALRRVLGPAAPELTARALRALTLVERAAAGTLESSPALAQAHLDRLLDRAPPSVVEAAADVVVGRLRWLTAGAAVAAGVAFVAGPMRLIEGLDVLAARGETAPLPLVWLDEVAVVAHPPAYLRREDRWLVLGTRAREPQGSRVSVRGTPRRAGRELVLTDGRAEVPFVSDGEGGVVAQFTLDRDVELRVAARFGAVRIVEPDPLSIEATPDAPPRVALEGAPRTVSPADFGGRLELRYAVADDHGLRQVDLVLRAGNREDRRVLARLDGEERRHDGGYALEADDPFLRDTYLPTLLTIEARDNQPAESPRWGRSAPITVIPPPIGQPEANRLTALTAGRDAVVDLVAWYLETGTAAPGQAPRVRNAAAIIASGLEAAGEAMPVPAGFATFVRGQARALTQPRPGTPVLRVAEDVALALDAAIARLALRDARDVSQRLAEVADEAAAGARLARETEQRDAGVERLTAAVAALGVGARELGRLGALGRDLGSVAEGELDRLGRARADDDLHGAELAARHLAARLRRPNPSFSTKQTGGVESSGGQALDSGEPSQADQRFDELAHELERLTQEHASDVGAVERALSEAERASDVEALKAEARRRATEIARAIAELPVMGDEPGTSRSAAARAHEQGTSMAQSLERLALGEAVERGRDALGALDEARRQREKGDPDGTAPDPLALNTARQRVAEHLAWAERELARVRRLADERARDGLGKTAERERAHAERASNLAGRGRNGQSSLPDELIGRLERAEALMRDAARRLEAGEGRAALELQRDAQRLLEQATPGKTTDQAPAPEAHEPRGAMNPHGEVPAEQEDHSQDFRRRVVEGLGGDRSGRYSPAVRRYAEGLLR